MSQDVKNLKWYDSRVSREVLFKENTSARERMMLRCYDEPRKIYDYLERFIFGQDEAKKAASILMYYTLHNKMKRNLIFAGPTGCGKTEIWRCLKSRFPNKIEIVDGSNITNDGWKGDKKWSTLFTSKIFRKPGYKILVVDEADKMMSPKYTSSGENVAFSVMSEGLKIMEGIKLGSGDDAVDTSNVSIVFCGAFSSRAVEKAKAMESSKIGFGSSYQKIEAYSEPLTRDDIIAFGAMPEFIGRITTVVNLNPMTKDDFKRIITDLSYGPIKKLSREYGFEVNVSDETLEELVTTSYESGMGVRGFENLLRGKIDEVLFNHYGQQQICC